MAMTAKQLIKRLEQMPDLDAEVIMGTLEFGIYQNIESTRYQHTEGVLVLDGSLYTVEDGQRVRAAESARQSDPSL